MYTGEQILLPFFLNYFSGMGLSSPFFTNEIECKV